jgi:parvulin-like peptidyl-prolyl isomerase
VAARRHSILAIRLASIRRPKLQAEEVQIPAVAFQLRRRFIAIVPGCRFAMSVSLSTIARTVVGFAFGIVICAASGDHASGQGPRSGPGGGGPGAGQNQGPSQAQIRAVLDAGLPEDPAAVVAVVGQSYVLAGDLMPRVEMRVKEILAKSPQQPGELEIRYIRSVIFRSLLNQSIQLKILRESFLLSQVGNQAADKRNEAEKRLQSRARQMFQETELPRLYKKFNVHTVAEVDDKLREQGSSFESARLDFIDQMLAHLYRSDVIPKDPEIAMIEVKNYYEDNIDKYQVKAQARWEQLTATFEASGGRDKAIAAINEMGREAYFGGSMQAVAKLKSQEPFAGRGGLHDWTNRGSLASSKLEAQIFSLPLGVMSEVIEDESGMHIVRVLERKPEGVKPISELQDEIRKKLKDQKIEEAIQKITSEMTKRVAVWTIYPDDIDGAMPLSSTQVASNLPDTSR